MESAITRHEVVKPRRSSVEHAATANSYVHDAWPGEIAWRLPCGPAKRTEYGVA
jgi:hypothetical protein